MSQSAEQVQLDLGVRTHSSEERDVLEAQKQALEMTLERFGYAETIGLMYRAIAQLEARWAQSLTKPVKV